YSSPYRFFGCRVKKIDDNCAFKIRVDIGGCPTGAIPAPTPAVVKSTHDVFLPNCGCGPDAQIGVGSHGFETFSRELGIDGANDSGETRREYSLRRLGLGLVWPRL